MLTFPVAVLINNKVECLLHIERDDLRYMDALYCGTDKYSGYEIYADIANRKMYAANPK